MTSAPGARAAEPSARGAPSLRPAGAFASALARVRAGASLQADGALAHATAAVLGRRRISAGESEAALLLRRDEAEPGRPGSIERAPSDPARETVAPEAAPRLVGPAALERLAIEAGRLGDRAFVELQLGRDVGVRLTRAAGGVEVVLTAAPALRGAAEAEVPALVAVLRARGVVLAGIAVRTPGGRSPPDGRRHALTEGRPSDTTAPPRSLRGTVAKW